MTIKFSDITGGGIPYGNNAGRPANPGIGKLYSNGEASRLEIYTLTGWQNIVQETPGVVSISGNYNESAASNSITINGTNFAAGAVAYAVGTNGLDYQASSTTVNSIVQIVASFANLSPAYEPYDIKVVNPSNLYGTLPDVLYVNNTPAWNTASGTLADVYETFSISTSVSASDAEGSTITYSVNSGSLPSGVTLNSSTGAITGTAPSVSGTTTYSFVINASDGENTSLRSFSIIVRDMVAASSIEYLLAAGGGGGGQDVGGGGGAGGLLTGTLSPTGSPYTISVGARGAGGVAQSSIANQKGGNTTAFGLTAIGGGGGGNYSGGNGAEGGSGGGGSGYSSPGVSAAGTPGQGYAGGSRGSATAGNNLVGAGGGGAGGIGSTMVLTDTATWSSNVPNPGGPGVSSSITGVSTVYCEGGRAWGDGMPSGQSMRVPSATQFGFGGDGAGTNASALGEATNESGTRGGPGVIIVAYPNTNRALTIEPGLTYEELNTRSGYRVYRFTAGSGTITF